MDDPDETEDRSKPLGNQEDDDRFKKKGLRAWASNEGVFSSKVVDDGKATTFGCLPNYVPTLEDVPATATNRFMDAVEERMRKYEALKNKQANWEAQLEMAASMTFKVPPVLERKLDKKRKSPKKKKEKKAKAEKKEKKAKKDKGREKCASKEKEKKAKGHAKEKKKEETDKHERIEARDTRETLKRNEMEEVLRVSKESEAEARQMEHRDRMLWQEEERLREVEHKKRMSNKEISTSSRMFQKAVLDLGACSSRIVSSRRQHAVESSRSKQNPGTLAAVHDDTAALSLIPAATTVSTATVTNANQGEVKDREYWQRYYDEKFGIMGRVDNNVATTQDLAINNGSAEKKRTSSMINIHSSNLDSSDTSSSSSSDSSDSESISALIEREKKSLRQ